MYAKDITVVRIRHKHLTEDYYIDPLPPTVYMSNEGAGEIVNGTIKWTLHHLDATFEHTFDGVETEEFFQIFRKMLDSKLTAIMLDTKPDTCPYSNDDLFEATDYALDKVFPTDDELESMPATINDLERLTMLIITGIERVYNTMRTRGTSAETDEAADTLTVEA